MFAGIDNPVLQSTISSVPAPFPASPALPSNAVQAIAGAVAQQTAVDMPQAQKLGAVIKNNDISVGMYGMNPQQLETAGLIKPGSARLVRSLAASGKNVNQVLPPSMFTGMPGAENLSALKTNLQAQTDAFSENLTQAQTQLQGAGVMTGQEVAGQVGGAVLSTAQNGLDATIGAIDAAAKGPLSNLTSTKGQVQGKLDKVLNDIGSGNFAGKVSEAGAGALSGLQSSVEAIASSPSLDQVIGQAQGIAASAFNSIKASIPTLQPGVPQNLTAIAKSSAAGTATASAVAVANDVKQQFQASAGSAVNTAVGAAAGAIGTSTAGLADMATGSFNGSITSKVGSTVSNIVGKAGVTGGVAENLVSLTTGSVTDKLGLSGAASAGQNAIASFQSAASLSGITSKAGDLSAAAQNVTGGIASAASGLASGITNLPGGQSAAGSIQNLAKATQNLPGTADLKGAIQGAATNAINGVTSQLTGKANDLLNKANGLLGQASSAGNQLKALASAGLPAGAAAQLQSAMGSIASAGSGIKMPKIGINTTDRGELTAAITSVLEDPQIPTPDLLGEVSEAAKSKVEEVKAKAETFKEENKNLQAKFTDLRQQSATEFGNYLMLRDTLPQGDPMIEEARKKALDLSKQADNVRKEMETLYKSNPDLAVANNYVATTYESSTTTVTENGQTTTTTTTSSTVTTSGG